MIKKNLKPILVLAGVLSLEDSDEGGLQENVLDLPWKDELCCESRSATAGGDVDQPNSSNRSLPHDCSFKNLPGKLHPRDPFGTSVLWRISLNLHEPQKTSSVDKRGCATSLILYRHHSLLTEQCSRPSTPAEMQPVAKLRVGVIL